MTTQTLTQSTEKSARSHRGKTAYLSGLAAEEIVAEKYSRGGYPILERRWRGSRGEIDLVAQDGDGLIFIEVKKSKTHAQAAQMLSQKQLMRICGAGNEFLTTQPRGMRTYVRVDVALVDEVGRIDVIENATM